MRRFGLLMFALCVGMLYLVIAIADYANRVAGIGVAGIAFATGGFIALYAIRQQLRAMGRGLPMALGPFPALIDAVAVGLFSIGGLLILSLLIQTVPVVILAALPIGACVKLYIDSRIRIARK